MTFDEWTTEAHRSLAAWTPEPAVRPTAVMDRPEAAVDPADLDLSPQHARRPVPTRRRVLSAVAAAAVVAAAVAAALALRPADTDVTAGPRAEPTPPATSEPTDPVEPSEPDPVSASAPRFDCSAADQEAGGPTAVFDESPDVAEWRVDDLPFTPEGPPATSVRGTLVELEGEDVPGTTARAATFVAAVAPAWMCTVWSPLIDVADPTRPGPVVEDDVVTNRLGGMCFVPDASATPGSVWGVDPTLATALDQVEGLTDWTVILADGGANGQGPGRLWMEFSFEADPSAGDSGSTTGVLAGVTAAVDAAGTAAAVPTECAVH